MKVMPERSKVTAEPNIAAQADVGSSTDTYAQRFEGAAGRYLLSVQTRAIERLCGPGHGKSAIDVGGGHGQVIGPLTAAGFDVTLLASEEAASERAVRMYGENLDIVLGDLSDPPVVDRSFDMAIALRMISHVGDWRQLIAGLCRVSRHAVIVDFAIPGGSNALAPLLFGLKKGFEGDTREFRVVSKADIRRAFEANGFMVEDSYGQFVLPMAVHRALKSPGISRVLEAALRFIGLAGWIGTPVIVRAVRVRPLVDEG